MTKFIELEDYDASIHAEILDAVTRSNKSTIEVCQNRAIQEARGYISNRYDCEAIFNARADDRIDLIVMYCIDISIYHILSSHNPQKLTPLRKERFDEAKTWLQGVRDEIINIEGAPQLEDKTDNCSHQILSNRKRITHR